VSFSTQEDVAGVFTDDSEDGSERGGAVAGGLPGSSGRLDESGSVDYDYDDDDDEFDMVMGEWSRRMVRGGVVCGDEEEERRDELSCDDDDALPRDMEFVVQNYQQQQQQQRKASADNQSLDSSSNNGSMTMSVYPAREASRVTCDV
jgi:hypothetical protein